MAKKKTAKRKPEYRFVVGRHSSGIIVLTDAFQDVLGAGLVQARTEQKRHLGTTIYELVPVDVDKKSCTCYGKVLSECPLHGIVQVCEGGSFRITKKAKER